MFFVLKKRKRQHMSDLNLDNHASMHAPLYMRHGKPDGHIATVTFVFPMKQSTAYPSWGMEYDSSEERKFNEWLKENGLSILSTSSSWVNGTVTKYLTFKKAEDAAMVKLYWG
jgi:hypothetical protein